MATLGKARFGKKRVNGCECTHSYSCGPCMKVVVPTGRDPVQAPPGRDGHRVPLSEADPGTP